MLEMVIEPQCCCLNAGLGCRDRGKPRCGVGNVESRPTEQQDQRLDPFIVQNTMEIIGIGRHETVSVFDQSPSQTHVHVAAAVFGFANGSTNRNFSRPITSEHGRSTTTAKTDVVVV
jgi:hypothetical protein